MTATRRIGVRAPPLTAVRTRRNRTVQPSFALSAEDPWAAVSHHGRISVIGIQFRRNEEKIPEFIAGPVDRFELRRLHKFVLYCSYPLQKVRNSSGVDNTR